MVRESKSPHSIPTFGVRTPNEKWRLVHACIKLNNATVPAQTSIPSKDVLLSNMSGCMLYSALDLVDEYYQILMRESDIPLTAVSTPSWILWEWLVIAQGLSNSPATRTEDGQTAMEVHLKHLRRVFEVMRANKLYVNIDKCVFEAEEIKVLGCFVSRVGVRADPGKVKAIAAWLIPRSQKDLRKWFGLANYLHKYSAGIKASLQQAPVLALSDENKPFSVVCDASDYAIGCALLQMDDEGRERAISFQSRQLKAAERNYPVHDKELLAMKYALVKFRRMARWLSFFAEYNFRVEYKPDKLNVLAGALSRRPDYKLAHISRVTTDLYDRIRLAYQEDENYTPLRVKPSGQASAPLQSLPVPTDSWKAMSLDFVFGLPADDKGNTGILVFVCHLSKMMHLALRVSLSWSTRDVSDRDPRFTGAFWDTLFQLLETKLTMSTADHPQTDGQTERVNRVLEDTLRSICAEAPRSWSDQLRMVEFALNNAVHASTGFTPFYLNGLRHPQVPLTLRGGTDASIVSGGEARKAFSSQFSEIEPKS
ncbi:Pol protein [Phytophthora palmivora]|uniref:Pol protein n=1 Tax=Phytophthora palmivora TaxID=4796 RepID=A0A2P4YVA3_9STRA|nr:Pol protein [Phytophthora palmivora]